MSQLRNLYLFFCNLFQASGWALTLFRILSNSTSSKSTNGAFYCAGELICLLQSLAFLEVIHGAICEFQIVDLGVFNLNISNRFVYLILAFEFQGIVPSGVLLPLMQWGGRTHFLLAIVRRIPEVQELSSVFITFVAWSISEVIRYSHYALYCVGSSPYWITLIRYNAFIVLYPIGVFTGEMWLMYQALPFIKKENLYADSLPFSYYKFIVVLLFCYPFLWMKLYLHLFRQRRSKLGKQQKKKRN